ncbi:hypothetical protein RN001_003848 [Aquatica leii]|uniref:Uncharacterized protein n=1 Tax=Aquatica leii TaxID=1421715 RepID=A0AAN7PIX3_9COLE|nr:hypothetical protein RN001_003848 [Aquatica leii]
MEFKKWQVRQPEEKIIFENRKKTLQQDFKNQLGLLVDHVKPGSSGTSNDGNTARRFFKNFEVSSKITGIDEGLIKRCSVILEAISSTFLIDREAFKTYAFETAKLYVDLYPWYYMPASMHKILIHGSDIIAHALLPMVQLSEEAQECRNKDLKCYRRSHTRKTSRETTNQDLLNLLLVSSDPYITSVRKLPPKFRQNLSHEVLQLLAPPNKEKEVLVTAMSQDVSDESSETMSVSDESD